MLQPSLHFITSTTSALFADVAEVASAPVVFLSHADAPVVLREPVCVNWLPGCVVPCPSHRCQKCFSSVG